MHQIFKKEKREKGEIHKSTAALESQEETPSADKHTQKSQKAWREINLIVDKTQQNQEYCSLLQLQTVY